MIAIVQMLIVPLLNVPEFKDLFPSAIGSECSWEVLLKGGGAFKSLEVLRSLWLHLWKRL